MGIFKYLKNKHRKNAELIKDVIKEIDSEHLIRLHYVSIEKFNRYSDNSTRYGKTEDMYGAVKLPEGMSCEDAYKVISYLSEKVEKENNLEPASAKSVQMVDKLLPDYGFERVVETGRLGHFHSVAFQAPRECNKVDGVIDLFTVGGHLSLFHKTKTYKDRYFNWFTADVTEKDVIDIYNKIGMDITGVLAKSKVAKDVVKHNMYLGK